MLTLDQIDQDRHLAQQGESLFSGETVLIEQRLDDPDEFAFNSGQLRCVGYKFVGWNSVGKQLEEAPQDESDFLFDRCMDYAVAADRNSTVVDKRAARLQIAGWAIFGAIFIHGFGVAWAIAESLGAQ